MEQTSVSPHYNCTAFWDEGSVFNINRGNVIEEHSDTLEILCKEDLS